MTVKGRKLAAADVMTAQEAEDITRAITSRVDELWDLIVVAYNRRADVALGYDSWDAYCDTEFRLARVRLPSEERQGVAMSLRSQGLSERAIAAATGTGAATVHRDLAAASDGAPAASRAGGQHAGMEPATGKRDATVTGLDGKRHRASRPSPRPDQDEQGFPPGIAPDIAHGAGYIGVDDPLMEVAEDHAKWVALLEYLDQFSNESHSYPGTLSAYQRVRLCESITRILATLGADQQDETSDAPAEIP